MSQGAPLSAPPTTPVTPPWRIGKYRIVRQIAQGGMAEIYLATSTGIEGFEKLCVLKRILPLLAGNQEFVQMFLDEARIAASLLHSNIAQVFDIGEDKGSYYFVMEFLRGEDVRHILQSSVKNKQFVPYEHVITIITGTCAGLHYAHEVRGKDGTPLQVVHRDISPQNIFVTHDGSVKLCDFGIAKSAAQLTETRVGTLKGKIRYMSPEQCQSEPLDRRSDVFALSIVLWELVCLRRLFSGKSDFDIFKAIVEEPLPKASTFRHDVPDGLEQIIMKGLARKREERFESAQDMQIALEDWSRAERVRTSPVRLAQFMAELFPAIASESYMTKLTEVDPLVGRIKELNENEGSDSSLVENIAGAATSAEKPRPTPVISKKGPVEAETDPSINYGLQPKRSKSIALALFLSMLLLAAAVVALMMRNRGQSTTPLVPPVSTEGPAKPTSPTKPADHTATPNAETTPKPVPAATLDALQVPNVPVPVAAPTAATTPNDPVSATAKAGSKAVGKKTKRNTTSSTSSPSKKSTGDNDDLLPP